MYLNISPMAAIAQSPCDKLQPRSPPIRLSVLGGLSNDKGEGEQVLEGVGLFDSILLPGEQGLLTYAGGYPTAGSWCYPRELNGARFLAVAVRLPLPPGESRLTSTASLIQLYRCEEDAGKSVSFGICATLPLVEKGDVLDLKWAHFPGEVPFSFLAASFTGGSLVIYSIANSALAACSMRFPGREGAEADRNAFACAVPVLASERVVVPSDLVARTFAWSRDGSTLVVGHVDGSISNYEVSVSSIDGKVECDISWCVSAHSGATLSVAWLSDSVLVSSGTDACVCVRDSREPSVTIDVYREGNNSWVRQLVPVCFSSTSDVACVTDLGILRFLVLRNGGFSRPAPEALQPVHKSVALQKGALFCATALYPDQVEHIEHSYAEFGAQSRKRFRRSAIPCVVYAAGTQGFVHEVALRRLPSAGVIANERPFFSRIRDQRVLQSWRQGRLASDYVVDVDEDGADKVDASPSQAGVGACSNGQVSGVEVTARDDGADLGVGGGKRASDHATDVAKVGDLAESGDLAEGGILSDRDGGTDSGVGRGKRASENASGLEKVGDRAEGDFVPAEKLGAGGTVSRGEQTERNMLSLFVEARHGRNLEVTAKEHFPSLETDATGYAGKGYREDWCTTVLAVDPRNQVLASGVASGFLTLLVLKPPLHRAPRMALFTEGEAVDETPTSKVRLTKSGTRAREKSGLYVDGNARRADVEEKLQRRKDAEKRKIQLIAEKRRKALLVEEERLEKKRQRIAAEERKKAEVQALEAKMNAMLQRNSKRAVERNVENAKNAAESRAALLERNRRKEAEEIAQAREKAEAAASAEQEAGAARNEVRATQRVAQGRAKKGNRSAKAKAIAAAEAKNAASAGAHGQADRKAERAGTSVEGAEPRCGAREKAPQAAREEAESPSVARTTRQPERHVLRSSTRSDMVSRRQVVKRNERAQSDVTSKPVVESQMTNSSKRSLADPVRDCEYPADYGEHAPCESKRTSSRRKKTAEAKAPRKKQKRG